MDVLVVVILALTRAGQHLDHFISYVLHKGIIKANAIISNAFINLKCLVNNEYKFYA